MRQRTKVREFWRVRWPDVDGGTHNFDGETKADVLPELHEARKAYGDEARLYRVTVYRGAKLRELTAWRRDPDGYTVMLAGSHDSDGASVERQGGRWMGRAWVGDVVVTSRGHRTKAAAMRAAEDALAWLGYRVAKGER